MVKTIVTFSIFLSLWSSNAYAVLYEFEGEPLPSFMQEAFKESQGFKTLGANQYLTTVPENSHELLEAKTHCKAELDYNVMHWYYTEQEGPFFPSGKVDGVSIPFSCYFPKAEYPLARKVDGCSTPTTGPIYDDSFKSACNKHDICYFQGDEKDSCDDKLLLDILSICNNDFSGLYEQTGCVTASSIYYAAMFTEEAQEAFDTNQAWQLAYDEFVEKVKDTTQRRWGSYAVIISSVLLN